MPACLPVKHRPSSEHTLFDPWKALLLASIAKQLLQKSKVLACSVNTDQLQLRREIIHYTTSCHRGLKDISCLPHTHTNIFQNAAVFLLGSMVTIFKRLPEDIQAFGARERALVQDMPLLKEGDSSCHSTQIIKMHVLGQRERTMPTGKHDCSMRMKSFAACSHFHLWM